MECITNYPERILPVTFFLLCLTGGILLFLPLSSNINLSFIDSIFTAVSAVCVTGLSVIDIGKELTGFGQFVLMLLIQLGGLGIMTISSIVFILLGKRMSVSQEKTARSIFDVESKNEIKKSLFVIFKYTLVVESVGALILALCFGHLESNMLTGLKYGIFTSISAFCNAGFFFNGNSLMNYTSEPIILYTISSLIILGGISPAICVSLITLKKGRKLSPLAIIVFYTTLTLLIGGALFFYISEYNGVLAGMSIFDKINNAWFQSATSRTAGFNSVDLADINAGTYIVMLILMILGGSPGGTAGGVKTSTIGVLMLTCYNTVRGRQNIIRNKKIQNSIVRKATTLMISYLLVIFIGVLMLFTTQIGSPAQYIFETISALGTVGLSQGITGSLDSVGKIIIISLMFLGRVGPATLICYLNTRSIDTKITYPDAKISLT